MTLTITIDIDNAAFADSGVDEIERILNDLCSRLPVEPQNGPTHPAGDYMLHDINGNYVGSARLA